MALAPIEIPLHRLMPEMAEITEANGSELLLRSPARSPRAVECALAIAAGAIPDVGFATSLTACFMAIGFDPYAKPLTYMFTVPQYDEFLFEIARSHCFTLAIEGVIPVTIPVPEGNDALRPWLRQRGMPL